MTEISKEQERRNYRRWLIFVMAMLAELIIHFSAPYLMPVTEYTTPVNLVAGVLFALCGLAILTDCVILVVDLARSEKDIAPIGGTKNKLYIGTEILISVAEQYMCLQSMPDVYPTLFLFVGMAVFIPCILAGLVGFLAILDCIGESSNNVVKNDEADYSPQKADSTSSANTTSAVDSGSNIMPSVYIGSTYSYNYDNNYDDYERDDEDDDDYDSEQEYRNRYEEFDNMVDDVLIARGHNPLDYGMFDGLERMDDAFGWDSDDDDY